MKNIVLGLVFVSVSLSSHANICDRHPLVQKQIIAATKQNKSCKDVTKEDLLEVEEIAITYDLDYKMTYGYDDQGKLKAPHKFSKFSVNDLKGLSNLKILDVQFTNITEIKREHLKDLKNLETLDISHNLIEKFDEDVFADLKNLKKLEFDSNEYFKGTLPEKVFAGLSKLEGIDMDECNISSLPAGVFQGLKSLKVIDLAKNELKTLPPSIFNNLPSLSAVYLNKNPIRKVKFEQNNNKVCYKFCLPY